jgi:lipoyl(octanoyl) transferase
VSFKIKYQDLGIKEYQETWDYQESLFNSIIDFKRDHSSSDPAIKAQDNYLLFVEHPHVYTLGKSGSENNLLLNHIQLQAKHAQFIKTNRGGDITYHGPGQIVGYPILDLEEANLSIKEYIHLLEQSVINAISVYGITGSRMNGATGVWLDPEIPNKARKICAIGVRASRHVTMHGFALNVNTNLEYFNYINPCGFIDKKVTSIQNELGQEVDFEETKMVMKTSFLKTFNVS